MCRTILWASVFALTPLLAVSTHAQPLAPSPSTQPALPGKPPRAAGSQPAGNVKQDLREIERALNSDQAESNSGELPAEEGSEGAGAPPLSGLSRALQSLNPDIALIADFALALFSTEAPSMSGGHDPRESGFHLQQLELAAGAAVDPYLRFDANLVFSQFGVEIEEAYATTLALPWNLQVRAGQFLTRFGRVNATHPHSWKFVDQMIMIGKFFGSEGNRGLGVETSLLLPLPWYVELMVSATDAAGEEGARSFYGAEDPGVSGPADFQYTLTAKQFFPLGEDWSLAWGLSAAMGPNSSGRDNRSEIFGTDLYLKYRPISRGSHTVISLELEGMLRRRQVPSDVLQDQGLFALLFYRFSKRWALAGRYEALTGVQQDPLDPLWDGLRQRLSANLTFWPTEFSRIRLQYNHDRPGWQEPYHGVFLTLEVSAGAHGAHTF